MDYINIGGNKVSVIGFGTHLIGGKTEPDYSKDDYYIALIRKAVSLGVNHIDTAEVYGNGHSEEIIGKAIQGIDRNKIFLASKVWSDNLSRDKLFNSLSASIRRLGVSYIDLYYIHYPNNKIPLKETMNALEEAKDKGLIKNIGVSNFSIELIKEANSYLKKSKIVAIQSEYSLLKKESSKDLVEFCQKEEIVFVAYKPLGKGLLFNSDIKLLEELSLKYKKSKAQIGLNWILSQDYVITIPKVSSIEHLNDNIASCDWKLEEKDFEFLSNTNFD